MRGTGCNRTRWLYTEEICLSIHASMGPSCTHNSPRNDKNGRIQFHEIIPEKGGYMGYE